MQHWKSSKLSRGAVRFVRQGAVMQVNDSRADEILGGDFRKRDGIIIIARIKTELEVRKGKRDGQRGPQFNFEDSLFMKFLGRD